MSKYAVVTGTPVKSIRNYKSRNQKKLTNRVARLRYAAAVATGSGELLSVVTESGTLKLYNVNQVSYSGNVKRDAERYAKKTGGHVVTTDSDTTV